MLVEQAGGADPALARAIRKRIEHHGRPFVGDDDEAEAEAPAEPSDGGRPGRPGTHREIDRVGERQPVDALEDEAEAELPFELDHDRRLVAAHRDDVAADDLALDAVALGLEQRLDRTVERHLGQAGPRRPSCHAPTILGYPPNQAARRSDSKARFAA